MPQEMNDLRCPIDGVSIWRNDLITLVSVEELTPALKEHIRERLAEICWGPTAKGSPLLAQSYEKTMQSLWRRVESKSDNTKIGMVGELLTHLFLATDDQGYTSVNRMFNLEEASIKKGFDLVLEREKDSQLFFVEVKSSATPHKNSSKKIKDLLKTSAKDIYGKLNDPADNLWSNALDHCSSALRKTDLRDRIEEILETYRDEAYTAPSSKDRHVVLSGVNFAGDCAYCLAEELSEELASEQNWGEFKSLLLFAAQKKTYQAVLKFIESEATQECL